MLKSLEKILSWKILVEDVTLLIKIEKNKSGKNHKLSKLLMSPKKQFKKVEKEQ